jgi:hypothetical protein
MAQAGYTPISLYYSTTAAAVPTAGNLVPGELAININDGKLYYENSSGVVTLLAQSSATSPVTTLSFGTTGLTPSTATSGAITVAGTLAVANGGTGVTSTGAAPFAIKGANSDITSLTGLTTPLSVAQGGTGAATLTANNVLLGNGTSAPLSVAPSTAGNVLTSNGTTWTSAAPTGGGAGGFVSVQYFTTAGSFTWTRPAGINKIYVYVVGGGGGGQYAGGGSNGTAGGGGGGCAIKLLNVTSIASAPVIVGPGGADAPGGSSIFNTTIIGGGGGVASNPGGYPVGGTGGSASGGDLNITGEKAGSADGSVAGTSGGKPAFFGQAGSAGGYGNSGGNGLYGGGGGGKGYGSFAGDGGSGIIVVYEYT